MKRVKHMSRVIVPFVIASIFIFTGLAIYLQFVTSVELSSTLIVSFYGFCTGELWMLASIKKSKINSPTTPSEDFADEIVEESTDTDLEAYNQGVEDTLARVRELLRKDESHE